MAKQTSVSRKIKEVLVSKCTKRKVACLACLTYLSIIRKVCKNVQKVRNSQSLGFLFLSNTH